MPIQVKNQKLKDRIYKEIEANENKAIAFYKKNQMDLGKKYEDAADKLYERNYKKIYKIS